MCRRSCTDDTPSPLPRSSQRKTHCLARSLTHSAKRRQLHAHQGRRRRLCRDEARFSWKQRDAQADVDISRHNLAVNCFASGHSRAGSLLYLCLRLRYSSPLLGALGVQSVTSHLFASSQLSCAEQEARARETAAGHERRWSVGAVAAWRRRSWRRRRSGWGCTHDACVGLAGCKAAGLAVPVRHL